MKTSVWKLGGLSWKELLKRVWSEFKADHIPDQSAELSYYFIFALFPLLLFLTALLGFFLEPGSALHNTILNYAGAIAPQSVVDIIDKVLREISAHATSGKISIGLVVALWSASAGMSAMITALNVAYEATAPRVWWKDKLIALVLTIGVAGLMLVAVVLAVFGGKAAELISSELGLGKTVEWLWKILQWPLLLFLILVAFNLLYYFAPNVKHIGWHWLMPGTVIGVAIWLLVSIGLKIYLGLSNNYSATYGSIATVIILLLWFYLSGLAILIGGEVNSEIEKATESQMNSAAAAS